MGGRREISKRADDISERGVKISIKSDITQAATQYLVQELAQDLAHIWIPHYVGSGPTLCCCLKREEGVCVVEDPPSSIPHNRPS